MIRYCDKKLKRSCYNKKLKKTHKFSVSSSKDAFLEGVFQMTTFLSNKSLSY